MKLIKYIAIAAAGAFILNACSTKPDVEFTTTVKMSGEWCVEYYDEADPGVVVHDYDKLLTYNTSDPGSGQVWVQESAYWPFKAKFNVDYPSLSFTQVTSTPNLAIANQSIKVYEGKVLTGAAHSRSGNVVDSIFLRVEFSDDPGVIYQVRGHQRTGFFEDEY